MQTLSKTQLKLLNILKTSKETANYLYFLPYYCIKLRFIKYCKCKLNFCVPKEFLTRLHFILVFGFLISNDKNICMKRILIISSKNIIYHVIYYLYTVTCKFLLDFMLGKSFFYYRIRNIQLLLQFLSQLLVSSELNYKTLLSLGFWCIFQYYVALDLLYI